MTGLSEGKPYKFRVKAVNKEGESEELETEKPIIAKNPFGELNFDISVVALQKKTDFGESGDFISILVHQRCLMCLFDSVY